MGDTGVMQNALVCPLVAGCRAQRIIGWRIHKQMHRNTSDLNLECLSSQQAVIIVADKIASRLNNAS